MRSGPNQTCHVNDGSPRVVENRPATFDPRGRCRFRLDRRPPGVAAIGAGTRARLAPMSLHLFAGLRVRDFHAARAWYERLLGDPTFFPYAREAVWTLAEERSVYVVESANGAGSSVVTVFVDDLDAQMAAIAARGLEPVEIETYSNGVRKALYRDPDGNEFGFGGALFDRGPSPPGPTSPLSV